MELRHLEYFYWVAKEGGFSRASRALRVAQPAISRMVRSLEESLGAPLLLRQSRQVTLTPLGTLVYRHCEVIFENARAIESLAEGGPGIAYSGRFAFGCNDAVAAALLPTALEKLTTLHPGLVPTVHTAPADAMLERVDRGELEFALLFYVPGRFERALEISAVARVPFRLVVSRLHRRTRRTLTSFLGSREADAPDVRSYPVFAKVRKRYPEARLRYSANSLVLHKELVLNGTGISVLPEFLVAAELKRDRLLDVFTDERFEFDLKLVRRKGARATPPLEALLEELRKGLERGRVGPG